MIYTGLTPDEECRRFVASYHHDGSWWILDIYAYDWEDAEARCKKLGVRLDGEFSCVIESSLGNRPLIDAYCRFRTFVSGLLNQLH
jgi:hypothetical protein